MARLTDDNVVATFQDLDTAREVLKALNNAGIDAGDISLLGRQVEEVASNPDTRLRDLESTSELSRKAASRGGLGAALGGLAGAAAFVIPGIGPVVGVGIWGAAAGGAIAGGVIGGMVGAIDATELGPEWEVTYGEPLQEGKVLVAVHAHDADDAETAVNIYEKHGVQRIDHLDHEGKPRPS